MESKSGGGLGIVAVVALTVLAVVGILFMRDGNSSGTTTTSPEFLVIQNGMASEQAVDAEAQLRLDSAAAVAEAQADSIGAERMQAVTSAFDDVPESVAVGTSSSVETSTEYAAAMRYAGQGPGFDCTRADGVVQETICADPGLSALDQYLSRRVTELRAAKQPISPEDRAWRAARLPACLSGADPVACLRKAYVERLRSIER
jgi:hypothetical protein